MRARRFLEDRLHRVDAGNAGHVQVEQHDVGPLRDDGLDAVEAVGGFADDLEPGDPRQQRRDAAPEQRVVVDDDDADAPRRRVSGVASAAASRVTPACCFGRAPAERARRALRARFRGWRARTERGAATSVPWPGRECTVTVPPMRAARSRMIRRPDVRVGVVLRARRVEAAAVVAHGERVIGTARQLDLDARRMRVLAHVRHRLLQDVHHLQLVVGRERHRRAADAGTRCACRSGARAGRAACGCRARRRLPRSRVRKCTSSSRTSA